MINISSFVFDNAAVTVNGTDLSDDVKSVTLEVSAAEVDDTAMGDTFISRLGGMKDWSVSIEFNQDHAASSVDSVLWAALGTPVTVTFKPENAATSTTNPQYSGSALLTSYGQGASVGDLAPASASFAGAGALTRATA